MTAYLISFDLNNPGQNYDDIDNAIKAYGTWCKIVTTTYVIVSEKSAKEIRDDLQKHIDSNDKLFVLKSGVEAAWTGFKQSTTDWLKKHL